MWRGLYLLRKLQQTDIIFLQYCWSAGGCGWQTQPQSSHPVFLLRSCSAGCRAGCLGDPSHSNTMTWAHVTAYLEATRVAPAWCLPPLASTIRAIKGYLFILYTNKNLDDVLYAKAKVLLYLVRQAPNVQKDLV